MKLNNLLAIMALCALLPMFSCGSDSNTESGSTEPATTGTEANPANTPAPTATDATGAVNPQFGTAADGATTPPPATTATAAPTGGAKHYTCPKNCKGSGGDAAGTCPVCGSAYVHNQAFHAAGANNAPPPSPAGTATPTTAAPTTATPPAPSPAQNAAGVFHYTCAKGCAGGAAAAGKCAKCGGDLAHNAAYHQ